MMHVSDTLIVDVILYAVLLLARAVFHSVDTVIKSPPGYKKNKPAVKLSTPISEVGTLSIILLLVEKRGQSREWSRGRETHRT